MEALFEKEVINENDLKEVMNNIGISDYRPAVLCILTDKDNKIILQRRGPKSRDEHYMLADIGGAFEKEDINFRNAIKREIEEEVGEDAEIVINDFIFAFLKKKFDIRSNSEVNWLFLVYKGELISGDLLLNEEGKCIAYERYLYDEFPRDEMIETSLFINDFYHNKLIEK